MSKNKTNALTILLITLLVATMPLSFSTMANAATYTYHSWVYCAVSPNVVGVGQPTLLQWWTADMPPDIGEQQGHIPGDRADNKLLEFCIFMIQRLTLMLILQQLV